MTTTTFLLGLGALLVGALSFGSIACTLLEMYNGTVSYRYLVRGGKVIKRRVVQ